MGEQRSGASRGMISSLRYDLLPRCIRCGIMLSMSTVTRSYRIRIYPNGAQERFLDRWFGAVRWLWNTALDIRSGAYRALGLKVTGNDVSKWLTQWKRTAGHEWLAEVPATVLTQILRDQDRAFGNFFARRARYPLAQAVAHERLAALPGYRCGLGGRLLEPAEAGAPEACRKPSQGRQARHGDPAPGCRWALPHLLLRRARSGALASRSAWTWGWSIWPR